MEEAGFDLPTWGSAKWCYISGSYILPGPGEGETNRKQNTTFSWMFWILCGEYPTWNQPSTWNSFGARHPAKCIQVLWLVLGAYINLSFLTNLCGFRLNEILKLQLLADDHQELESVKSRVDSNWRQVHHHTPYDFTWTLHNPWVACLFWL